MGLSSWMMVTTVSLKLQDAKSILVTYFVKGKINGDWWSYYCNALHGSYALQHDWQLDTMKILGTKHMHTKLASMAILCPPR
jgi:hypothetical protein